MLKYYKSSEVIQDNILSHFTYLLLERIAYQMGDITGLWGCVKYPSTKVVRKADGTLSADGIRIYRIDGGFKIIYPSGVYHGVLKNNRIKWCRKRDGAVSYWDRVVCSWRKSAAEFKSKIDSQKLRDVEFTGCAYVRCRR